MRKTHTPAKSNKRLYVCLAAILAVLMATAVLVVAAGPTWAAPNNGNNGNNANSGNGNGNGNTATTASQTIFLKGSGSSFSAGGWQNVFTLGEIEEGSVPSVWHLVYSGKVFNAISEMQITFTNGFVFSWIPDMGPSVNGGGNNMGWVIVAPYDWSIDYVNKGNNNDSGSFLKTTEAGNPQFNISGFTPGAKAEKPTEPPIDDPDPDVFYKREKPYFFDFLFMLHLDIVSDGSGNDGGDSTATATAVGGGGINTGKGWQLAATINGSFIRYQINKNGDPDDIVRDWFEPGAPDAAAMEVPFEIVAGSKLNVIGAGTITITKDGQFSFAFKLFAGSGYKLASGNESVKWDVFTSEDDPRFIAFLNGGNGHLAYRANQNSCYLGDILQEGEWSGWVLIED